MRRCLTMFVCVVVGLAGVAGAAVAKDTFPAPLRVACDENFTPYTFVDENGEPAGLLVDVWKLWSEKTGRPVEFVFFNWDGTIQALSDGRADIHSGLFKNPERARWMAFSRPFHASTIGVFYPKKNGPFTRFDQLSGKMVGSIAGSDPLQHLKDMGAEDVVVVSFETPQAMIDAAQRGAVSAFVDETLGTWTLLAQMGKADAFADMDRELVRRQFVAAVAAEHKALMPVIQAGLDRITEAEMAALKGKWSRDGT